MTLDSMAAIVTGGASGLGEAVVREFATAGAKVSIFDTDTANAERVADETGAAYFHVAVNDEPSVQHGLEMAAGRHGEAQVLVNCAGIGAPPRRVAGKKGPYPLDVWQRILDVNLTGTFNCVRLAAARMISLDPLDTGERGVIINTSSINGADGPAGTVAYTASKAAIDGMTITMARDLASYGIRVCTIAPGPFATPLVLKSPEESLRGMIGPMQFPKRLGEPSEFAALARHCVENCMLNGTVIRIDAATRMDQR
ncbi:MAG: SDR family NAD(P)-dependent oxidoreductase [Candidatus Hydrogenedentota bacterium]